MTKTIDFTKNRLEPINKFQDSDYQFPTSVTHASFSRPAQNLQSINRSFIGSKTSQDQYKTGQFQKKASMQLAKNQTLTLLKLTQEIASRGQLSSRQQPFQRQSTAPMARSMRNSGEIDPLTKLRMRKDDNWNKIV